MKEALKTGPLGCSFEVTEDFVKWGNDIDINKINVYTE